MEELPRNSRTMKGTQEGRTASEKKVEKVVATNVVLRKKPLGKRFAEMFFGGDAQGALGYVVSDVLIPAAKDAITDGITAGIEKALYGEARSSRTRGSRRTGRTSFTSYNRASSPSPLIRRDRDYEREAPRRRESRESSIYEYEDFVFATHMDAEEVIRKMHYYLEKYDKVTIGDLNGLVGRSVDDFVGEDWGWYDIKGARPVRNRGGGYALQLPRPVELD